MSEIQRIIDLQRRANELREERWRVLMDYHGTLPPPSRRLRLRWAVRRRVSGWRRRLAQVIDPD